MKRLFLFTILFALILSGCNSSAGNSNGSENKQITIGTWGGDYENFLKKFVEPNLSSNHSLVYVPEGTAARMTKVRIEKDGQGTYDIVTLEDNTMQQLVDEELLMELDYSKIPNAANISPELKNPYFIPHIYSAGTIVYNERLVEETPDSWEILWDPKYKGKVGIHTVIFPRYIFAAAAAEGVGQSQEWDKAWEKLLSLSENEPKFYNSQEQLATALQTGEIAMTVTWRARAIQWNEAGGDPISSVIPDEGTFPTVFGAGIPKNAKNIDAAYEYLNAMLEPGGQASFATEMGYAPTVTNAQLPEEVQKQISFSEDELNRIYTIDLEYITKNYEGWKEKFDREFASQ